jgi:hypothetical protein
MRKVAIAIVVFSVPFISFASTYGSNFITGGTPSCDTEFNGSTEACINATDGNTATHWTTTNTGYPHWIAYDLGSGVTKHMDKVDIYGNGSYLKNYKFQGSSNGTDWTDLQSGTMSNIGVNQWNSYYLDRLSAYRYFRIYGTDNWDASNYMSMAEWNAYECTDCVATSTDSSTSTLSISDALKWEIFIILDAILFFAALVGTAIWVRKNFWI